MSKRKRMHITKTQDGWKGQVEGNEQASFTTETKEAAIDRGRKQMKNTEGQLIIHKSDGQFQEERTYGNDPFPPKG